MSAPAKMTDKTSHAVGDFIRICAQSTTWEVNMKLFKSKDKDNTNDDLKETEEQEDVINGGNGEKPESVRAAEKRIGALLRCLGGLVLAAALLFLTGFSIFDLIEGPKEADALQDEETGAFVTRDVFAIIGTYGGDQEDFGKSIVPMGSQFVPAEFTKRYYESAKKISDQTAEYVDGLLPALDLYVVVQGTVGELSEEQYAELELWFSENKDTLVEKGMITDVEDSSVYLSDKVLLVDTVNGKNQTLVLIATGLAALSFAYVLAEFFILAFGGIKRKAAGNVKSGGEEEPPEDELFPEENDGPEDGE